tara:strand:- start:1135 stop:1611 length:477 start_codon:yes stop_codon:yes gene_type:complete
MKKIYCDMDGVLCDFVKGAEKLTGKKIDVWAQGSKSEKWGQIKSKKDFWSTLPWNPGGKQLWNFLKNYDTEILSAYVEDIYDKNCIPGKKSWASRNLGISSNKINLVKRVQKQQFADKNSILIDDYPKNVNEFRARGGQGVVHNGDTSRTIRLLKRLI